MKDESRAQSAESWRGGMVGNAVRKGQPELGTMLSLLSKFAPDSEPSCIALPRRRERPASADKFQADLLDLTLGGLKNRDPHRVA